jgi:glycosyltransferase involved in cell wall biosynthesis
MREPTLSVIMPNYNHAHYLGAALEAMLNQSYQPHEILVIDDGSTDNSVAIVERLQRDAPHVRLVRHAQNQGVIASANESLALVTGDFIHLAAADDRVLPGFYEKTMRLLAQYPQAGLCSTLSLAIDAQGREQGRVPGPVVTSRPDFITPERGLHLLRQYGWWVYGTTAVVRRKALLEMGGFRPELEFICDWLVYQVLPLRYGACFIPEPLVAWRKMDMGYGGSGIANTQHALTLIDRTIALMRSEYRDVFPPDYVTFRENIWLGAVSQAAWGRVRREQRAFLDGAAGWLRTPTWRDGLMLAGIELSGRLQTLLVVAHLIVRFRGVRGTLRYALDTRVHPRLGRKS